MPTIQGTNGIPGHEDYFGYLGTHHLGEPGPISFSLGVIAPVPDYVEIVKSVEDARNEDGYL
jgi:hypothetical protein